MEAPTKTVIYIIGVVVFLIGIGIAVHFARAYPYPNIIEQHLKEAQKQHEERVKELQEALDKAATDLANSEKKYATLKKKIKEKAQEAADVQAPVTGKEIRDRFTRLGYPPSR